MSKKLRSTGTELMEVLYYNVKKAGGIMQYYTIAIIFFAMFSSLILNASYCGGAAVGILIKSNTTFGCNGRLEECLKMEEDLELEFLMNPYISRILLPHGKKGGAGASQNPNKAFPCGHYKTDTPQYAKCINDEKAKNKNHHCDPTRSVYNKGICTPKKSPT